MGVLVLIRSMFKSLSLMKLKGLRYPNGLFGAARLSVNTGYDKVWLRDNVYMALGLEAAQDIEGAKKTLQSIFDILLKHEYKIDWAIREKPDQKYKYIHARFDPRTYEEFHEDWGNKQNDAVGAFLFRVGELYRKGVLVARGTDDLRILQKLVYYLGSIEYWQDPDNGVWENEEELHASSIGACLAGLISVKSLVDVPEEYISSGRLALDALLPRESVSKEVDLALLTLIYPYNIVSNEQRDEILNNVETKLVREKGVVRYFGDYYYNNGSEAEWVMGFPWLAIIYKRLGNIGKYDHYMAKTYSCMNWKGDLPELYLGGTSSYNENTPLGWNHALMLCT
jgi:GH15 family glucan-1,4-alpha-glucosidase